MTQAHRFVLSIHRGNEAMSTWEHVAIALRRVADAIEEPGEPIADADRGSVHDNNGNRVGGWYTDMGGQ